MLCNLTAIILDIPKFIKIHKITKNKLGATTLFKTSLVIILLISTKNVDTDR